MAASSRVVVAVPGDNGLAVPQDSEVPALFVAQEGRGRPLFTSCVCSTSAFVMDRGSLREKNNARPRSLEPIDFEPYIRQVEDTILEEEDDFNKRLEIEDQLRRRGEPDDTVPVKYKPKRPLPPTREVMVAPPSLPAVRTEEEYLRSHVDMLETLVRSLRKQNEEWRGKFRKEAENRTKILDLDSQVLQLMSSGRDYVKQNHLLKHQNEVDRAVIRKLRVQILDLKTAVASQEMATVKSAEIADLLYKPRFETITEEHETLHEEHANLRIHHETLATELTKHTRDKRRKERQQKVEEYILDEAKKNKKKAGKKPPTKKQGTSKKGKNAPPTVPEQLEMALSMLKAQRPQVPSLQPTDFFYEEESAHLSHAKVENVGAFISAPLRSSALALPWTQYKSTPPKDMKVPLVTEKVLLTFFALAASAKSKQDQEETADVPVQNTVSYAAVLFDNLLKKYGDWGIAETYAHGIVEAVRRYYSENSRIAFFGRLMGIVDESLYDERACVVLLRLLHMGTNGNIAMAMTEYGIFDHEQTDDLSSFLFVNLTQAMSNTREVFQNLTVNFEIGSLFLQPLAFEKLENLIRQYSILETDAKVIARTGSDRKVDIDTFMQVSMNAWYDQAQADARGMVEKVWKPFECAEEQHFDMDFLHQLVDYCSPKKGFDPNILIPLYKQLVSCEAPRSSRVNKEMFVTLMNAYGVTPPKHEHELLDKVKKKKGNAKQRR